MDGWMDGREVDGNKRGGKEEKRREIRKEWKGRQ